MTLLEKLSRIKGIPSRSTFKNPGSLPEGRLLDFVIQKHRAVRSGTHSDVRFGNKELGLFSWATRKELPKPGGRPIVLYEQPTHSYAYKDFEGELKKGYGKGTVKKQEEGKILVVEKSPHKIKFVIAHRGDPETFTMVKTKGVGDNWLLFNTTPTEAIQLKKERFKSIPEKDVKKVIEDPKVVLSPKIDGAAVVVKLTKDHPEIYSYRQSVKNTPIVHTHRIGMDKILVPKEMQGTLLRGELYGEKGGKIIPAAELGGLLNASVAKSLTKQKDEGIRLKINLFGAVPPKAEGSAFNAPLKDRMAIIRKAMSYLNSEKFNVPRYANTEAEKKELWERISKGKDPLTREGVVAVPKEGGKIPIKVKTYPESDVWIRKIFPAEVGSKYAGTHAGGFEYSNSPSGPIVGKVGTGLTDAVRKDMWENQDKWIGRMARIKSQEKFPSGAHRAPVFIARHEDYGPTKKADAAVLVTIFGKAIKDG